MKIIRDLHHCPKEYHAAVIALGNFDGVHRGHQAILRQCIELARTQNAKAAVMTFEPHPREFFSRENGRLRLYPFRRKAELLRHMGIDALFVMRFTRHSSALSAQAFVEEVLHRQLKARHIVTGYNFAFGKGRQGDTAYLTEAASRLGFGFTTCPPVYDAQGHAVSSSAIRHALTQGDVQTAKALLGRPYTIEGHVRHGDKRGRDLGFPTANIALTRLFKPRFGIYAVRLRIEEGVYDAVASLGIRPMFGGAEPLLEVHMLAHNADLYGRHVRVEFVGFIRDEQHFATIQALQEEMARDCIRAKELLHVSVA